MMKILGKYLTSTTTVICIRSFGAQIVFVSKLCHRVASIKRMVLPHQCKQRMYIFDPLIYRATFFKMVKKFSGG